MKIEREVKNDHIARIEGKAGIWVSLGDTIDARIDVTEGPRFFERITLGKYYEDAAAICSRICSFCSIPHKLTPIAAIEDALKIEVSPQTTILRDILFYGNMIESHALHLFLFVAPDYLGFPDAFSMAQKHPELMKHAMALKNFGSVVQKILGSRDVHPENAIVGGFGKLPTQEHIKKINALGKQVLNAAIDAVDFFADFEYPSYVTMDRTHLSINPIRDYGVYGEELVSSTNKSFPIKNYKDYITEHVISHSFAKHSKFDGQPFMVGALSRLVNNTNKIDGTAKELFDTYSAIFKPDNCFSNNYAQAIEMVYYIEKIIKLTDHLAIIDEKPAEVTETNGIGYSVTEAPRGLLIYEISIENKSVSSLNVITPTDMFLPAMELDALNMAKGMWKEGYKDPTLIGNRVEMTVRTFDPCISCSVHVIKK